MTQWSRALTSLAENLFSIPRMTWCLTTICNSRSQGSDGLLWLPEASSLHTCNQNTHAWQSQKEITLEKRILSNHQEKGFSSFSSIHVIFILQIQSDSVKYLHLRDLLFSEGLNLSSFKSFRACWQGFQYSAISTSLGPNVGLVC